VFDRLFAWLRRLFTGQTGPEGQPSGSQRKTRRRRKLGRVTPPEPLRHQPWRGSREAPVTEQPPYHFARFADRKGTFRDLSTDGDEKFLSARELPIFHTPQQLADWLQIPLGRLAWLTHHGRTGRRPETVEASHYHYHWLKKRTGGRRLIEAPKSQLKSVQRRILREILDRVPPHPNAHGFVRERSVVSNAAPHVGSRFVIRLDLENFYANVRFSRVVAIFRRLGYSREAALWLSRLTTAALPANMPFAEGDPESVRPYLAPHLPQGAPTSPALANLSAFAMDIRLSGFAAAFAARYTRYADDLTFSGPESLGRALWKFLPLATKIIRSERFRVNVRKRKVVRSNQRQRVTGVIVNEKVNVSRGEFDRLKAILTNCARHGAASQNRDGRENFAAHLRGRIAHVRQLNPHRGEKLQRLYERIRW